MALGPCACPVVIIITKSLCRYGKGPGLITPPPNHQPPDLQVWAYVEEQQHKAYMPHVEFRLQILVPCVVRCAQFHAVNSD
ncbi:hypothetical protein KQX54_010406 [Cotesia glomerata]|uniref:Secreted protein n=1 Tax=Cotesia glomerata TaxID=32391 RepID=A0AAV7ICU2_COTGL|nr:hypothetical protein KQX54_010406 [Cotesia glomerata]